MPVGFLTNQQLRTAAMKFLREYHPDDTVPVPIEEIIELQFEMDIIPVQDLQRNFGIEGTLAGDFSGIYVDEFVQNARTNRYRFTLAHEIGHLILHKEHLKQLGPFDSIDQWIACLNRMNGSDHDVMEYQGYVFAGYVLVPNHHLERVFIENLPGVETLIEQAKKSGFSRANFLNIALDHMANNIAPFFEVSPESMGKRIRNEKLDKYIK